MLETFVKQAESFSIELGGRRAGEMGAGDFAGSTLP